MSVEPLAPKEQGDEFHCPLCSALIQIEWFEIKCGVNCKGCWQSCEECGMEIELSGHGRGCSQAEGDE